MSEDQTQISPLDEVDSIADLLSVFLDDIDPIASAALKGMAIDIQRATVKVRAELSGWERLVNELRGGKGVTRERELLRMALTYLDAAAIRADKAFNTTRLTGPADEIRFFLSNCPEDVECVWRMASYADDGSLKSTSPIATESLWVDPDGSYSSSGARRERSEVRWAAG